MLEVYCICPGERIQDFIFFPVKLSFFYPFEISGLSAFRSWKTIVFFFGEVISTRLLKVYSRCSEEHIRGKKLIFCEKLLIFAVFRLWNLWKFFRRHFLLLRKFQKKCQHWFIRVELNVQVEKMFFFDRPMCL